ALPTAHSPQSTASLPRRYRETLIMVPRKNGKTPLAAGIALASLNLDHEIGAQNLCAAASVDQASLLFRHAAGMVTQDADLHDRFKVFGGQGQRAIQYPAESASLRVIASEASTQHGFNGHLAIIDELHAQPNRELVDVIETASASANRTQPLVVYITTSDFEG